MAWLSRHKSLVGGVALLIMLLAPFGMYFAFLAGARILLWGLLAAMAAAMAVMMRTG